MLNVFVRAYTHVTACGVATLVGAPRQAATSAAGTLAGWWDTATVGVTSVVSTTAVVDAARSLAVKSTIAAKAAQRVASAVNVQSTGATVGQHAPHANPNAGDANSAEEGGVATPTRRPRRRGACSPCSGWSLFCQRRPVRHGRRGGVYNNVSNHEPSTVVVEELPDDGGDAHADSGAGAQTPHCQLVPHGDVNNEDHLVVYLKKRPVYGTEWSAALTRLGQDHVGVVVAPLRCVRSCGGSLAVSLEGAQHGAQQGSGAMDATGTVAAPTAFDFGPVNGKDFSIFRVCDAEIRRDLFDDGESALVATTTRSMEDIEEFNRSYGRTYHLGVSDCRDYAAALVQHLTGVNIRPSDLAHFISSTRAGCSTSSSSPQGTGSDDSCGNTGHRMGATVHDGDGTNRKGGLFRVGLADMHSLISGAQAPFHLGLGL